MRRLIVTALLSVVCLWAVAQDGPYVIYGERGVKVYSFDKELQADSTLVENRRQVGPMRVVSHEGGYEFSVALHSVATPPAKYKMPEKIVVLSDPHGDMVPFVRVLQGAGAIDENLDWCLGKGHLVVIGDISDRGKDVTAIYWLVYRLEEQARRAGGCVHMLLGNHEVMIAQGDVRYAKPKYIEAAETMGVSMRRLWSTDTELGRWLLSRNQIEKIGDWLFVHAGISPELVATGMSADQINRIVRKYMPLDRAEAKKDPKADLVMRTNGPLWYRGMVNQQERVLAPEELAQIKSHFGARRIVVGHTIQDEVAQYYDGDVIAVNVDNDDNMEDGLSRGIVITADEVWAIDTEGRRREFLNR